MALFLILVLSFMLSCQPHGEKKANRLRFGISFTEEHGKKPLDGRMLLMISLDDSKEPRFQISSRSPNAQLIFGPDVNGLEPGETAIIDGTVFGFLLKSIFYEKQRDPLVNQLSNHG